MGIKARQMELNIKLVGATVEHEGEVILVCEGELPENCIVVFMDKPSWVRLKKELSAEDLKRLGF